ncbi:MAG: hypothetical protein Q9157_008690 [Trypethelium eluteriae]
MNNPTRASALVAPLNIVKGEKHGDDSKKPKEDQTHQLISATQTRVVTPPLTPEQAAEYPQVRQSEDGAIFHNFLRAFYNFHPASTVSSSAEEESSITVPINVGDVILVHSVHPNGWADGTLLASGARGWIPTNYCEAYSHEYIRNLLSALTRVWDILRASEFEDDLKLFSKQDYVRSMIAAVRYFLRPLIIRQIDKTPARDRRDTAIHGRAAEPVGRIGLEGLQSGDPSSPLPRRVVARRGCAGRWCCGGWRTGKGSAPTATNRIGRRRERKPRSRTI